MSSERPVHRLRRGILVLLVTTLVLLVLGELGLRVAGDRRRAFERSLGNMHPRFAALIEGRVYRDLDDPVRRYGLRPGAQVEIDGWSFRINEYGARGPDFPQKKAPGEKRVLCLGDSYGFGLWCGEDETLVAHIARLATEAARAAGDGATTWRGVNLSVPGYHTGQELRALEQDGLGLDPDLVIVYFYGNDILREGFFFEDSVPALRSDSTPLPVGLRRLLWNSHLYGFLVRRWERSYLSGSAPPHLDPDVPWSHTRPENQAYTAEALAGIARLCRERGVPLFVIHQPLLSWSGDAWSEDWTALPLARWMEAQRAELELAGIDLTGWLRCNADGMDRGPHKPPDEHYFMLERYFADEEVQDFFAALDRGETPAFELPTDPDFHLTGAGYEHVARLAFAELERLGYLP